jgi:hypothetical protein
MIGDYNVPINEYEHKSRIINKIVEFINKKYKK